jgi:hypothetical protein
MTMSDGNVTSETADLLETLAESRYFLRHTVRDLSDEQASRRTTASELCLRRAACCCISLPKPRSTQATPTSCASPRDGAKSMG